MITIDILINLPFFELISSFSNTLDDLLLSSKLLIYKLTFIYLIISKYKFQNKKLPFKILFSLNELVLLEPIKSSTKKNVNKLIYNYQNI